MSRGQKLDLFVGANIEDGWSEVQTPKKSTNNNEITEPSKHQLYFSKEKRNGKSVTLVGPFALQEDDANDKLKKMKKKLGCGGSYKNNFMEFQGDIKEKIRALLVEEGFRFRQGH